MDWRRYEVEIYQKLKSEFPEVNITFDGKILGHQSKVERQIDVLAVGKFMGHEITLAVECKYYSKNIDVKIVDGFIGFLEDIKADIGIIITNKNIQIKTSLHKTSAIRTACRVPPAG
ncbi:restriction endonuclease [Paenibacillus sp. 19GGS1-52]|uniref:restriction endonuclease n=1 Tax=Paenibacillus sp. 19GGS1-52 TaxID=2758563 RepID=UPI001EFA5176|nr:restriction endonuclease [Paenibacillus sp. 19GGS1-52]ULO04851.1 restriction endonuclease [Paenibacillus sp. 19GGS1-52]